MNLKLINMNNKGITPTQMMKLKELNQKLYTGITSTDREELIENFDDFLQQYEKHIKFMEELNFFKNSIKQRFYTKQMELKVAKSDKNQVAMVKTYLETGKTLTQLQAIEFFGAFRLAAIIHTLRHEFKLNIVDVGSGRFAVYKLIEQ